jgi:hypothetical protein
MIALPRLIAPGGRRVVSVRWFISSLDHEALYRIREGEASSMERRCIKRRRKVIEWLNDEGADSFRPLIGSDSEV